MSAIWHWLLQVTGIANESGRWYAFWSGFGSDLSELALLAAVVGFYRHHRCASCHRLGRLPVRGTLSKTCHKHSTRAHHHELWTKHKIDHPEQHELLRTR